MVKLSTSSKDFLNPMDITVKDRLDREELKIKSGFLITLCDVIAGGNAGLENDEKGIIDRCIDRVYDEYFNDPKPENMPTLEDLYNALVNYEPDYTLPSELTVAAKAKALRIANSLIMYVHGSQDYFNHRTNVDSHNRIICFDIRDGRYEMLYAKPQFYDPVVQEYIKMYRFKDAKEVEDHPVKSGKVIMGIKHLPKEFANEIKAIVDNFPIVKKHKKSFIMIDGYFQVIRKYKNDAVIDEIVFGDAEDLVFPAKKEYLSEILDGLYVKVGRIIE